MRHDVSLIEGGRVPAFCPLGDVEAPGPEGFRGARRIHTPSAICRAIQAQTFRAAPNNREARSALERGDARIERSLHAGKRQLTRQAGDQHLDGLAILYCSRHKGLSKSTRYSLQTPHRSITALEQHGYSVGFHARMSSDDAHHLDPVNATSVEIAARK